MVGGGNRISWSTEKVKKLLSDIPLRKKEEKIFEKTDEELAFLEKCLSAYGDIERDLLQKLYVNKLSLRSIEKRTGISRYYIHQKTECVLQELSELFTKNF